MHITTSDAGRVLAKLKFELVECKHHVRGFFVVDGKRLFAVHYSNGRKDMPGSIPHRFRKSLNLSVDEFHELVGCTLGLEEYKKLLSEKGIL